jgi:hypothetical protein
MTFEGLHIKDDPDLLAEFVLGRLETGDRVRIEAHIGDCPDCAEAVRRETVVAAGIRRAGRDRLKSVLAAKGRAMDRPVRWPRIVSVAALLAIAAGVGIYEQWFSGKGPITGQLQTRTAMPQNEIASNDDLAKPDNLPAAPSQGGKRPSMGKLSTTGRAGESGMTEESDKSGNAIASGEFAAAPPAGKSASLDSRAAPAAAVQEMRRDAEEPLMAAWVEGTRLPDQGVSERSMADAKTRAQGGAGGTVLKKAEQYRAKDALEAEAPGSTSNSVQFSIAQRPAATLPVTQQSAAQMYRNSVQTMVVRKGDSLALTLYLDSLVDQRTIANANVQQIGRDSLIVNVGKQRIGYRLMQLQQK